jgi:hypothetical protein
MNEEKDDEEDEDEDEAKVQDARDSERERERESACTSHGEHHSIGEHLDELLVHEPHVSSAKEAYVAGSLVCHRQEFLQRVG